MEHDDNFALLVELMLEILQTYYLGVENDSHILLLESGLLCILKTNVLSLRSDAQSPSSFLSFLFRL